MYTARYLLNNILLNNYRFLDCVQLMVLSCMSVKTLQALAPVKLLHWIKQYPSIGIKIGITVSYMQCTTRLLVL